MYFTRHETLQRVQHHLALRPIELANSWQMFLNDATSQTPGDYALIQHTATQVRGLLGHIQLLDDLHGGYDPSRTQTRSQYLGEGGDIKDATLSIKRFNREQFILQAWVEINFAIRLVFNNQQIIFIRNLQQLLTLLHGKSDT